MNEFYCGGENSYINFVSSECFFTGPEMTWVTRFLLRSSAMKSQKAVSLFFSVAVIGACAMTAPAAWAAQGALMFHGSVTNATCDAQALSAPSTIPPFKTLQAGTHVSVGLSRGDNACGQRALPVQASYAELSSIEPNVHAGIVTLTYQ
ncbi:hypothetical protein ACQKEN_12610 [Pseudomonas sp. NPDC078416]|uniref:hypothetical protein n=1 Tax=Pseudomonas sp. NPDC078416 TaxID=3390637 RepID=UPI003D01679A